MSGNTTVNETTLPPEVAAFVNNTMELVTAGLIAGGVVFGIIGIVLLCCRCIRLRTSDEAKQARQLKRRNEYGVRKRNEADDAALETAKKLKSAQRERKGRLAAIDERLAKSFARIVPGMRGVADSDEERNSEDDGDGEVWSPHATNGLTSPVDITSSNVLPAPNRARSGSLSRDMRQEVGDASAVAGDRSHEVDVDLQQLSMPCRRVNGVAHVIGVTHRLPVPRNTEEESLYGDRNGWFNAVAHADLRSEELRVMELQAAQSAHVMKQRLSAEVTAIENAQLLSGLVSPRRGPRSSPSMMREESDLPRRFRLELVAPQEYLSDALL